MSAAPGFGDQKVNSHGSQHADDADYIERQPPVESGSERGAEGHTQRGAQRRSQIENRPSPSAPLAREIIRDDRIGGRYATGFTDTHGHTRDDQLSVVPRYPARGGRPAPQRTRNRQHPHAIGAIRQPTDWNSDEAVKQREIEARQHAELTVRDVQTVLNGLGEDRDQLPVEEVEYINEAQHPKDQPRPNHRQHQTDTEKNSQQTNDNTKQKQPKTNQPGRPRPPV